MKSDMTWIHSVSSASWRFFKIFKTRFARCLCLCLSSPPITSETGGTIGRRAEESSDSPGLSGNVLGDVRVANSLSYIPQIRQERVG